MKSYFLYLFWKTCSIAFYATSYLLFGALIAFAILANTSNDIKQIQGVSSKLEDFINSDEKSAIFTAQELNEGLFYIILENSKNENAQISAMPPIPNISVNENIITIAVPFYVNIFSNNIKFNAFVNIDSSDESVNLESNKVKIGNARLPNFLKEKFIKSLLNFYTPMGDTFSRYYSDFSKVEFITTDSNDIKIIK